MCGQPILGRAGVPSDFELIGELRHVLRVKIGAQVGEHGAYRAKWSAPPARPPAEFYRPRDRIAVQNFL